MEHLVIPHGYRELLSPKETEKAILRIKDAFQTALAELGFEPGTGLYTDMNAIRPDDRMDNTHSLYVDQWDWELAITNARRTLQYLTRVVRTIYDVIRWTERFVCHEYQELTPELPDDITFFHAEDLAERYPRLTARERETEVCREYGAVFVIGIGADSTARSRPVSGPTECVDAARKRGSICCRRLSQRPA